MNVSKFLFERLDVMLGVAGDNQRETSDQLP